MDITVGLSSNTLEFIGVLHEVARAIFIFACLFGAVLIGRRIYLAISKRACFANKTMKAGNVFAGIFVGLCCISIAMMIAIQLSVCASMTVVYNQTISEIYYAMNEQCENSVSWSQAEKLKGYLAERSYEINEPAMITIKDSKAKKAYKIFITCKDSGCEGYKRLDFYTKDEDTGELEKVAISGQAVAEGIQEEYDISQLNDKSVLVIE